MDVVNRLPKIESFCLFSCAQTGAVSYGKLANIRRSNHQLEFQDHRGSWYTSCESLARHKQTVEAICA
ncbi:hypothetical protein [Umboniibacter marinipuniceus]|uniref:Uncharacterized protein n=1 Tax=Umboniibacter marinipuniceus TaxID=569599 RepID=A0A3M0A4V5_9GAMM|nr:hypothetical protein [Umboniibacter marinipuniceus]RMA79414.1 hypothetical protein DFR27_1855 [Umboniibacter marinipuniceus]